MPDDLVSRVLSAITEREAIARGAAEYSAEEWGTASSAVLDLGIPDLDGLIPVPAGPIAHHMEANDPLATLRLCQSLRDIVDLHKPIDGHCESCLESESDLYGKTYETAPCTTLIILARGLGIEDTPRSTERTAP